MFGFRLRRNTRWLGLGCSLLVAGCAATAPKPPYPAFVQSAALPDMFLAHLPGVRAKRFAGNVDTRRSSNRLDLPPDWSSSTGGLPNKSVEIFVLAGALTLGEFALQAGSYAYLPDGSTGVAMSTERGARLLYFLDDANPAAVIRTPLISSRDLIPWNSLSEDARDVGLSIKELRRDPGSGAQTFLLRVDPSARQSWQSLSVVEEGYLLEGEYRHSECFDGSVATDDYTAGGYYYRPADAVHAGPEAKATTPAVWYVRLLANGERTMHTQCGTE